jgi:hypothetical protein
MMPDRPLMPWTLTALGARPPQHDPSGSGERGGNERNRA